MSVSISVSININISVSISIVISMNISINTRKFFTDNYSGDKMEKNNVDRAGSTYGGLPTRVWAGKTEGKKPLGKLRLRWGESIKMNIQEVGWRGMEWIALAQDRDRWRAVVNAVMNFGLHTMR
jgi:hypothetical protein